MPQTMRPDRVAWIREALRLHATGMTYRDVADKLGLPYERVQRGCNLYLQDHPTERKSAPKPSASPTPSPELLRGGVTLADLAERLGVSARVALAHIEDWRERGTCIDEADGVYRVSTIPHAEPQTVDAGWKGEQIIRFGLLGDTHINSHYTQLTHLHALYDIFRAEGVTDVYHTGDIDDGEQMRPGHHYECYNQGADAHVAEIVRVYPRLDGLQTTFIIGNHDMSLIKHVGFDMGKAISAERLDMRYVGQSQAYVNITPACVMELRHPLDGTAYALSYKVQKMIEAVSGGEKPAIMATGHYHKAEYLFYRNVHSIQTGTLCAQTPWMRGKGIAAHVGGWIIEIRVNDDGTINRFTSTFFPFYRAIKDDWKNWQ